MIDEDFRVWLIEVNTNPYLGYQNAHLKISNLKFKSFKQNDLRYDRINYFTFIPKENYGTY